MGLTPRVAVKPHAASPFCIVLPPSSLLGQPTALRLTKRGVFLSRGANASRRRQTPCRFAFLYCPPALVPVGATHRAAAHQAVTHNARARRGRGTPDLKECGQAAMRCSGEGGGGCLLGRSLSFLPYDLFVLWLPSVPCLSELDLKFLEPRFSAKTNLFRTRIVIGTVAKWFSAGSPKLYLSKRQGWWPFRESTGLSSPSPPYSAPRLS